jgi:hypothetical protein
VFSLNYDLCVEKNCKEESVERGFADSMQWDWRQYDESIPEKKPIYLYKLHGSTDWYYDEDDILTYSADPSSIEDAAIIFGTSYKFQYKDPFLFLAYEFRRWTLASRLILCIGYGFGDEHINQIIQQALNQSARRLLLAVAPYKVLDDKRIEEIEKAIGIRNQGQIRVINCTAKDFMENEMNLKFLSDLFPKSEEELFPVVEDPIATNT